MADPSTNGSQQGDGYVQGGPSDGMEQRCASCHALVGHLHAPGCGGQAVHIFASKPQHVEAIQWTGENEPALWDATNGKVRLYDDATGQRLQLLAGTDGAQGWVDVPVGHWLVHQPNDLTDIWPVEDAYFRAKYEAVPGA